MCVHVHACVCDRNSAELNKLRSEYAGLMKELADSNSKLQQEEHQRKSLEVNYKQNVSQLEVQSSRCPTFIELVLRLPAAKAEIGLTQIYLPCTASDLVRWGHSVFREMGGDYSGFLGMGRGKKIARSNHCVGSGS